MYNFKYYIAEREIITCMDLIKLYINKKNRYSIHKSSIWHYNFSISHIFDVSSYNMMRTYCTDKYLNVIDIYRGNSVKILDDLGNRYLYRNTEI